ncbi:WD domain, G-beta repeat [Plasmodiophora brassicae]
MGSDLERRVEVLLADLTDAINELTQENRMLRRRARLSGRAPGPGGSVATIRIDNRLKNMFKMSMARPDVQSWIQSYRLTGHQDGIADVSTAAWDNSLAATACADGTAVVWWLPYRTQAFTFRHEGAVNSVRFHPTEALVVTASGDTTACVLSIKARTTGARRGSSASAVDEPLDGDNQSQAPGFSRSLSWPGQSTALVDADHDDNAVGRNRSASVTSSSSKPYVIDEPDCWLTGHNAVVSCADWVLDGAQIATGSWDGKCRIWDIGDGRAVVSHVLKGHTGRIHNLSTTPSAPLVATASQDETVRLWDTRQASSCMTFRGHSADVTSVVFPYGRTPDIIASASDDRTAHIWDIRIAKKPMTEIPCASRVNRLCFSPNSALLTLPADDGSVHSYNLSGELIIKLSAREAPVILTSAAWTEDGSQILSAGWDQSITVWRRADERGVADAVQDASPASPTAAAATAAAAAAAAASRS